MGNKYSCINEYMPLSSSKKLDAQSVELSEALNTDVADFDAHVLNIVVEILHEFKIYLQAKIVEK